MATVKDVLERAEEYAASGQDEKARRFYQAVIDRMPGTKEALDAQKRLDTMVKSAAVTFDLEDLDGPPPKTQASRPGTSADVQPARPAGKVKTCRACGQVIPKSAKVCPYCGAKQKGKTLWIVLGAVALFLVIVVAAAGGGSDSSSKKGSAKSSQSRAVSTQKKETAPSVPTEYRSALTKAKQYSSMMHMSKQGIYDQLTSEYGEKFSAEAAQYAIDHLKVDYNQNALAKAKDYQSQMNMSPEAIRSQLTSSSGEKFTQSEADYAVNHLK